MKKFVSTISSIAGCCLALFFASCSKKAPPLVVMTTSDCVPFSMEDNEGKLVGFDIDLVKAAAKEMDLDVQFKVVNFDELFSALQAKQCALAAAAISKTDERAALIDFSSPYHSTGFVLLCQASAPIQTLEDLSNKYVGVRAGTVQETVFKSDSKVLSVPNLFTRSFEKFTPKDMVTKILNNELSAVVVNADTAIYIMNNNNGFKAIPLGNIGNIDMCLAFPKGSAYKEKMSAILKGFEDSGEMQKMKEKWLAPAQK